MYLEFIYGSPTLSRLCGMQQTSNQDLKNDFLNYISEYKLLIQVLDREGTGRYYIFAKLIKYKLESIVYPMSFHQEGLQM